MSLVRDLLNKKGHDVATVERDATVFEAIRLMNERRIGAVVVMQEGRIAGIFTERDVMNRVAGAERDPKKTKVHEVMTDKVAFCVQNTTIDACRSVMTRHKLRHLPVVEGGKLVGMVSSGDILAQELQESEETIKYLHEYMQGPR
ncbi:MAG TPA: CBS domain-containing protein [Phycisphaerae bacterium]|nr:CBS domain-containing protein [Phycisphaerae bacterium]